MAKYTKGSVSAIISQSNSLKKSQNPQGERTCARLNSKPLNLENVLSINCGNVYQEESVKPFSCIKAKRNSVRVSNEKLNIKKRLGVSPSNDEGAEENLKRLKPEGRQIVVSSENFLSRSGKVAGEETKLNKDKMQVILDPIQHKLMQASETCEVSVGSLGRGKKSEVNSNKDPEIYTSDEELTVFVGNLPLSYDHKKVVKLFSKFGKIKNARIRCVPVANMSLPKKTCAITKKFHPHRNSAIAYVVFKSKESVSKAVAENGMIIDGHHLRIDHAVTQKKDLTKSVFVGGLPFDIEDDELWDAFKNCGEIKDVRVIRDEKVSMGKGFGYVNFKSAASVELALKLNGHEIKQRKINVQRCIKQRNNFHKPQNMRIPMNMQKLQRLNSKAKHSRLSLGNTYATNDFQGRKAQRKQKKKKLKPTKDAIRKNKIKSIFLPPSKEGKKDCFPPKQK